MLTTFAGLTNGASMAGGLSRSADEGTQFHDGSVDGAVMWRRRSEELSRVCIEL